MRAGDLWSCKLSPSSGHSWVLTSKSLTHLNVAGHRPNSSRGGRVGIHGLGLRPLLVSHHNTRPGLESPPHLLPALHPLTWHLNTGASDPCLVLRKKGNTLLSAHRVTVLGPW